MLIRRWQARSILAALTLTTGLAITLERGVAVAAGTDDRTTTEAVLRAVEASPKKDVVAEMVARSRAAVDRANKLRSAGDEAHAVLADGLARTWAEAARDVLRAVEVEDKAQAARRAATDAGVSAERERAQLEEGIAQSGRLRAQLDAVEKESKEQPARTSAAANADTDGGAPRPKGPKTSPNAPSPANPTPAPARDGGAR